MHGCLCHVPHPTCFHHLTLRTPPPPPQAVQHYSAVLHLDPDNHHALHNRASTLLQLHQPQGALADLDMLLQRDPTNTAALTSRAAAMQMMQAAGGDRM